MEHPDGRAVSRLWEAPRIAYELAVEWAERLGELTVGSGGAPGQRLLEEMPPISKAWDDLRTGDRHDVMVALGAQARSAIWEVRKLRGMDESQPLLVDVRYYTAKICDQAKEAVRALSDPSGSDPWKMPECSHCAALVATALIDLQVSAIEATGIADPVYVLRMLMGNLQLPAPREAGHDTDD